MASSFKIKLRLPTREEEEVSAPPRLEESGSEEEEMDELEESGAENQQEDEEDDEDSSSDDASSMIGASSSLVQGSSPLKEGMMSSPPGSPSQTEEVRMKKRKSRAKLAEQEARMRSRKSGEFDGDGDDDMQVSTTFDDLPISKRRKANIKAGAAGPGRGWRKGLKHGMKPVYTIPEGGEELLLPKATKSTNYTSAKPRSTATRAPSKGIIQYPPIPQQKSMAPVKSLAKIPQGFPVAAPLDRSGLTKQPRRWKQGKREILTIGGRIFHASTWWGGEDKGFMPPKEDHEPAPAKGKAATGANTPVATIKGAKNSPGSAADSSPQPPDMVEPQPKPPQQQQPTKIKLKTNTSKLQVQDEEAVNWRGSSPAYTLAS